VAAAVKKSNAVGESVASASAEASSLLLSGGSKPDRMPDRSRVDEIEAEAAAAAAAAQKGSAEIAPVMQGVKKNEKTKQEVLAAVKKEKLGAEEAIFEGVNAKTDTPLDVKVVSPGTKKEGRMVSFSTAPSLKPKVSGQELVIGVDPDEDPIRKIMQSEPQEARKLLGIESEPVGHGRNAATKSNIGASTSYRSQQKLVKNLENKSQDVLNAAQNFIGSAQERASAAGSKIASDDLNNKLKGEKGGAEEVMEDPVDTDKKVDLIGTEINDIQDKIEEEKLKGANVVDSPLNTPWLLMGFPVAPLGIMYTYTVMQFVLPPLIAVGSAIVFALSWQAWLTLFGCCFLGVILSWPVLRNVDALKAVTLPIDLALLEVEEKIIEAWEKAKPGLEKQFRESFLKHIYPYIRQLDDLTYEKYKFSIIRAIKAWTLCLRYDDLVSTVLPFAPRTRDPEVAAAEYEHNFMVDICFQSVSEIHNLKIKSVWIEWFQGDMILEHIGRQDVTKSKKGDLTVTYPPPESENRFSISQEVRLSFYPSFEEEGTDFQDKFDDAPIRLRLMGRKALPLYSNDGNAHWLKSQDEVVFLGETVISAKRLGCGTQRSLNEPVLSDVRIPFFFRDYEDYHSAVVTARTTVTRVDSSSYSYRESLSDLASGDWSLKVNLYELRSLAAADDSGSSDPFVVVRAFGAEKRSQTFKATLSCVVDEMLFFNQAMTGQEVEDAKVSIIVYDWNLFGAPVMLGQVEFDVSNIFRLPNHEFYRRWVALTKSTKGNKPQGFMKLSVSVLAPGSSLPVLHSEHEDREEFANAALLKNEIVKAPKFEVQSWVVHISIGWADMLTQLVGEESAIDVVRGYLEVEYTGLPTMKSRTFHGGAEKITDPRVGDVVKIGLNRTVYVNEEFIVPLTVTNGQLMVEGCKVRLMHRTQSSVTPNKYIGEVNVNFLGLVQRVGKTIIRGNKRDGERDGDRLEPAAMMPPRWYNFYGRPTGQGKPSDHGSAFRGRLLVGVAAKRGAVKRPIVRPCPPPVRPRTALYQIEFQICRATELPVPDLWNIRVEGRVGLYQFGHSIPHEVVRNEAVSWGANSVIRLNCLQLPEDVDQVPDMFITLVKRKPEHVELLPSSSNEARSDHEESERWTPFAFLRLPSSTLILNQPTPKWMFMDAVSDHEGVDPERVPGSLLYNCRLKRIPVDLHDVLEAEELEQSLTTPSFSEEVGKIADEEQVEAQAWAEQLAADPKLHTEKVDPEVKRQREKRSARKVKLMKAVDTRSVMEQLEPAGTFTPAIGKEIYYELNALILKGRNLPAADPSGLSDPLVKVVVGDRSQKARLICKQTSAPIWDEIITVTNIAVREGERFPNVNVMVYDWDEDFNLDFLGRAIVNSSSIEEDLPDALTARWYPVFSMSPELPMGEILADFQLRKLPDGVMLEEKDDQPLTATADLSKVVMPKRSKSVLRICVVGVEDISFLQFPGGKAFLEFSVTRSSDPDDDVNVSGSTKQGALLLDREYEANCSILDIVLTELDIPEDLQFSQSLNVFCQAEFPYSSAATKTLGTASIDLTSFMPRLLRSKKAYGDLFKDQFGMNEPIPLRLIKKYHYKPETVVAFEDETMLLEGGPEYLLSDINRHLDLNHGLGDSVDTPESLEEVPIQRVGYPEEVITKKQEQIEELMKKVAAVQLEIAVTMAKIRQAWYGTFEAISQVMPDVALRLGFPDTHEEPLLLARKAAEEELAISSESTVLIRRDRRFSEDDLEKDMRGSMFGEFALFRGDNRSLQSVSGEALRSGGIEGQLDPNIGEVSRQKEERRMTLLEGHRPVVGKVKARFDLLDLAVDENGRVTQEEKEMARLMSLRQFSRVFVPLEVMVRVYILRGMGLEQIGSVCNSYVTAKFFGGFPEAFTTRFNPVLNTDNPNYFVMFESRVKMPGGQVRLEVKDRLSPQVALPLAYPWYVKGPAGSRFGIVQSDLTLNAESFGLGWSELIGDTEIDLDQRWYNPQWRQLSTTPVESRSLWKAGSVNMKGKLEVFVDMVNAVDYDAQPRLYKPVKVVGPQGHRFVFRVVVFKAMDVYLPYLRSDNPNKLANFYVKLRIGNREADARRTDLCRGSADGKAQWNWRTMWTLDLPDTEIKPRLKLQIFDDTSSGIGQDDLCATGDLKLRSVFDEMLEKNEMILKKRQWVILGHPGFPQVDAKVEIAIEILPEAEASKKLCGYGPDGWKLNQDEDYVLPRPFRPAPFSLVNPVPFINFQIMSAVNNIQWALATYLLPFPFLPMIIQFVWMTPWWWYGMGGLAGLIIFLRVFLLEMARYARMRDEEKKQAAEEAAELLGQGEKLFFKEEEL